MSSRDPDYCVYCLEVNAPPGTSERTLQSLYTYLQQTVRGRLQEAS